jgi:hypothetical protein
MNSATGDGGGNSAAGHRSEAPGKLFGRLKRWFSGSAPLAVEEAPGADAPPAAALVAEQPAIAEPGETAPPPTGEAAAKEVSPVSSAPDAVPTDVAGLSASPPTEQILPEAEAAQEHDTDGQTEEWEGELDLVRSERDFLKARVGSLEDQLKSAESSAARFQAELGGERAERERLGSLSQSVQGELEDARRQAQQEREAAQEKIRLLEAELARKEDEAREEGAAADERVTLVQQALEVLEPQFRQEREAAASRIQQLEAERDKSRATYSELEEQVRSLERELEEAQRRPRKKKDGADTSTSISRWEGLKSRFLPRDQGTGEGVEERSGASPEPARDHAPAQESKPARREAVEDRAAEAALPAAGMTATRSISGEDAESLYRQSMNRLTVLLACADIVLMNPKLEPNVRQTAQEIKAQGQALLDLIKSFTLPPASHPGP